MTKDQATHIKFVPKIDHNGKEFTVTYFCPEKEQVAYILQSVNLRNEFIEALKAFMTIKGSRANEYWDIQGNPTKELEEKIQNVLVKVGEYGN